MIELKRNGKTGVVESYKNGKKLSKVITMGDSTKEKKNDKDKKLKDAGRWW